MPLFQNEGIVKMAITVRVYPEGMWPGGTHYHVVERLGIEGGFEVKLYKGMGGIPPDYRVFAFPPPNRVSFDKSDKRSRLLGIVPQFQVSLVLEYSHVLCNKFFPRRSNDNTPP